MVKVEYFVSGRKADLAELNKLLTSRVEEFVLMQIKNKIEEQLRSKLSLEEIEKITLKIEANGLENIKTSLSGPEEILSKVDIK